MWRGRLLRDDIMVSLVVEGDASGRRRFSGTSARFCERKAIIGEEMTPVNLPVLRRLLVLRRAR